LIEQGNGELDERTNFPSAVSALSCCAEGYLWNESGGARDAELFARDYHTLPGAGQVEALAQCLRFQLVDRHWVCRNVGETSVALPRGVQAPESHQGVQVLSALAHGGFSRPQLHFCSLRFGAFLREIEFRDIPRCLEALGDLPGGGERVCNRLEQFQALLVGLVTIKRDLDCASEVEHGRGHLELGLVKSSGGDALTQGQVEEVQKAQRGAQFQLCRTAADREADDAVKHRVSEQSRLHEIGLCHAEVGIHRLQLPIVQQRHLDRRIGRQRAVQQRLDVLCHLRIQCGVAMPDYPFAAPGDDRGINVRETGLLVNGRTACHQWKQHAESTYVLCDPPPPSFPCETLRWHRLSPTRALHSWSFSMLMMVCVCVSRVKRMASPAFSGVSSDGGVTV
jgi:hypothetical protein